MLLQVCRKAGFADNKPRVLAERVKPWPRIAVMARPTILDTLFIASNSDNCEALLKAVSANSSIYRDEKGVEKINLCRGKNIDNPYFDKASRTF